MTSSRKPCLHHLPNLRVSTSRVMNLLTNLKPNLELCEKASRTNPHLESSLLLSHLLAPRVFKEEPSLRTKITWSWVRRVWYSLPQGTTVEFSHLKRTPSIRHPSQLSLTKSPWTCLLPTLEARRRRLVHYPLRPSRKKNLKSLQPNQQLT